MSNSETERIGLAVVESYEKAKGRNVKRVHKCGYDITSECEGDERHIEVKTTKESKFSRRWLEEMEYNKLFSDPNFWVYLVTVANGKPPSVRELDAAAVQKRFKREIKHYQFDFS